MGRGRLRLSGLEVTSHGPGPVIMMPVNFKTLSLSERQEVTRLESAGKSDTDSGGGQPDWPPGRTALSLDSAAPAQAPPGRGAAGGRLFPSGVNLIIESPSEGGGSHGPGHESRVPARHYAGSAAHCGRQPGNLSPGTRRVPVPPADQPEAAGPPPPGAPGAGRLAFRVRRARPGPAAEPSY